jgi:DnaK suppressor protein
MSISKNDLDQYKKILEEEQESVQEKLSRLEKSSVDFGDDVDGLDEESDETEELGNILSVKETIEGRSKRIEKALEKITQGTYGTCELCGKEIEEKLLAIDPESEFCRACKVEEKN